MSTSYFRLADYFGYQTAVSARILSSVPASQGSRTYSVNLQKIFTDYQTTIDDNIINLELKIRNIFFVLAPQIAACIDKVTKGENIIPADDLSEMPYCLELRNMITEIMTRLTGYYREYYNALMDMQASAPVPAFDGVKTLYDLQGPLNTLINETRILLYSVENVNECLNHITTDRSPAGMLQYLYRAQSDMQNVLFYLDNFTFSYN